MSGNIRISTSEDRGGKVIEVTYMTGVEDGLDRELMLTITVGLEQTKRGGMTKYAVIYQKDNDFHLEEFNAQKAKDVAHAYHHAAKIANLLEESYPEVDPKVREWAGEQEYGYDSSDSDGMFF